MPNSIKGLGVVIEEEMYFCFDYIVGPILDNVLVI